MLSRLRSCLLGALLFSSACRSWPTPRSMRLVRPAPPIAAERCELTPEPAAPTGRTPPPTAEGALSLVDLRGDDRLAVVDEFVTAWSPDGERVYTATRTAVFVWGTRSGALEASWPLGAPMDFVGQVVVSPDGTSIGVGGNTRAPGASADAPVVWLLRTGEHPTATAFPGVGGALHVSADGRRMVAYGHAWDLATGELRTTPTLPSPPVSLLWMPDGLRAVVITSQPAVERHAYATALWDAVTGREIHRFPGTDSVYFVALSGDGERVAVLHDGLDVFSTRTFERVSRLTDDSLYRRVSLSRDGRLALVADASCSAFDPGASSCHLPLPSLVLWDVDRAVRLARTHDEDRENWVFTGDGRFLTGPGTRHAYRLLRVDGFAPVAFGDGIRSVSPDGRFALYVRGPTLAVAALDGPPLPAYERPARVIARSTDGTRSAALDADGRLRVEGPGSCMRLATVERDPYNQRPPGTGLIHSVAFSDDGATLVALTHGDHDRPQVRALDSRTGAERWSMQVTDGNAAAFLTAGTVLVQGEDLPEVLRYDAFTGALLGTGRAPPHRYTTPAYGGATDRVRRIALAVATADGSRVGTTSRFEEATWFSRWDLAHPERVVDVRVDDGIDRIAVSRDGVWAVGLRGGGVRLYRADGEQPVEVDAGHRGSVTALAFSAAGDRLFSAGYDGTLAVKAVATGQVTGRARFPWDGVTSLWVSPDGAELRVETLRGMRARFRCR